MVNFLLTDINETIKTNESTLAFQNQMLVIVCIVKDTVTSDSPLEMISRDTTLESKIHNVNIVQRMTVIMYSVSYINVSV